MITRSCTRRARSSGSTVVLSDAQFEAVYRRTGRKRCVPKCASPGLALLDLEDVSFWVTEVTPTTAVLSAAFHFGNRLHSASDEVASDGFDVTDGIPDLVSNAIVLGIIAPLEQFQQVSIAQVKVHPVGADLEFGESEYLPVEAPLFR